MTLLNFDTLMSNAVRNGTYDSLTLDANNNIALCLLGDGKTCVVLDRDRGEIARFERESYFTGGHWSDVDIDQAFSFIG